MRREYVKAHPKGHAGNEDLYHEDTLQAWLIEVRDPEPEPEFDARLFLPKEGDQ